MRGPGRPGGAVFFLDPPFLASASWDGTVRLRTWRTGKLVRTLEGRIGRLHALAVSGDAQWLVAGGEKGICVWRKEGTWWRPRRFVLPPVTALAFHPADTRLFTGAAHRWLPD